MRLNIRVSRTMNGPEAPLGRFERYLIRVPEKMRLKHDLSVGDPLHLKTANGGKLVLTVQPALLKDIFYDEESCYVIKKIFDRVNLNSGKRKIEEDVKLLKSITLGCDPEFFMVDKRNNYFLSAGSIFGGKRTRLGSDCGLVELRPDPARTEEEVVKKMRRLMHMANQKLFNAMRTRNHYRGRELDFIARSSLGNKNAGFHLHFGLHPRLKQRTPATNMFLRQVVNVLDFYVSLPSSIPEGEADCGRRSGKTRYGRPGDFKNANGITLEYRVPGGYHMRSPMLAKGLIGLGALVVEDVLSRTKVTTHGFKKLSNFSTYDHVRELYPRIPDRQMVVRAIISRKGTIAQRYLDNIASDLIDMLGFDNHAKSVMEFIEYIASDNHNISEIMSENWS